MNILIAGRPGIGKTTLIKKLIEILPFPIGGFYTEEIKKGKERTGFSLKTLGGKEMVLADISIDSPYRVGKYKVDVDTFERIGVAGLQKAIADKGLIIIDEIGKMELYSEKFKEVVWKALDKKCTVATIKIGDAGFIGKIKQRTDVKIIDLDPGNRDSLPADIAQMILENRKKYNQR